MEWSEMLRFLKSLLKGLPSYKRHPFLSMRCIGGGWACGEGLQRSILTISQFGLDFQHPSYHAHISTTTWPNFKIQSTREVFETSLMRLKQEMLNKKAITGQENGPKWGHFEWKWGMTLLLEHSVPQLFILPAVSMYIEGWPCKIVFEIPCLGCVMAISENMDIWTWMTKG